MNGYVAQVIQRFKALNASQKSLLFGGLLVLASVITGLNLANSPKEPAQAPQPVVVTSEATYDAYSVYLAHNPRADLILSPEDAQARAYLGCGQQWAPGTVDAALADAYRPTGICGAKG